MHVRKVFASRQIEAPLTFACNISVYTLQTRKLANIELKKFTPEIFKRTNHPSDQATTSSLLSFTMIMTTSSVTISTSQERK